MRIDLQKSKQVLTDACISQKGEDYSSRRAFGIRFHQIYKLRSDGYSFKQISELLQMAGLKLSKSTVESYFREHCLEEMEKCAREMDEQIAVLVKLTNSDPGLAVPRKEGLHCRALMPAKPLAKRDDVPDEIYLDGEMEHPAIPGLLLTKDERLHGGYLEMVDNGETRTETTSERIFRIKWQKPAPPFSSRFS